MPEFITAPGAELYFITVILLLCLSFPSWRSLFFAHNPSTPSNDSIQTRIQWLDMVRGICILAVIAIHVLFILIPLGTNLKFFILINNLLRFPVGIFLVLTGAFLSKNSAQKKPYRSTLTRKLINIYIPYLIICTIFAAYTRLSVVEFFTGAMTGRLMVPYYYLIVLAQLYLIFPLLKAMSPSSFFLPIAAAVSITSHLTGVGKELGGFPLALPYLFYFAYGVKNSKNITGVPNHKQISRVVLVIFLFVVLNLQYPEYLLNLNFFYTIATFELLNIYRNRLQKIPGSGLLSHIGKNSLWIYLVHFPVVFVVIHTIRTLNICQISVFIFSFLAGSGASIVLADIAGYLYLHLKQSVQIARADT